MRAIVQRVTRAEVFVEGQSTGRIGLGLLVYVGIADGDAAADLQYIADKICHVRIFPDPEGRLNLDIRQAGGDVLLVSNFTLLGDVRQGRRPDFTMAGAPTIAEAMYEELCRRLRAEGLTVATGRFRAMMAIEAANDGPINILLNSKRVF